MKYMILYLVILLLNYEAYEVDTGQLLHLHSSCGYAFEETVVKLVRKYRYNNAR